MTLHNLITELTEILNLTPEQQFRVTAKIKRLIHHEKASLYHRHFLYSRGMPIMERPYDPLDPDRDRGRIVGYEPPLDEYLSEILESKAKHHAELAKLSDEEIVTWDIGTHKYERT